MVESILQLFMTEQQAETIVSHAVIEVIFMVLFVTFAAAIFVHFILYNKLRRIRNYIRETNSIDIAPLNRFQAEYELNKNRQSIKVETFVQKKFSGWRVLNVPVVSLIKMIGMTVSVFILVGVLGTFIGLAMSLGSITATGDQLVENVALVLAGMDVAFYTSIAGMGFSLVMTVVTRVANTEYMLTDIMLKTESYLEENEQDGLSRLIHVSETINASVVELRESNEAALGKMVQSFEGFQEYTVGLQQSAKDLAKFNEGLTQNLKDFAVIFNSMRELTTGFDKGVSKLNKHFDQLFSYFHKMDVRNEKMTSAFVETYKKIDELSNTQTETLNQFQSSVVELKDYFSSIVQRQGTIQAAFERVVGQSDQLVQAMKDNNQKFETIFGNDVSLKLGGIAANLRELKGDFDTLGHSISGLPDALHTINNVQKEYKTLLMNRFAELERFNQEFGNHLRDHAVQSQNFDKHLHDASRSYEQIGMKNNQMVQEMNRTIAQLSDSFNQRENQIEASVGFLKDTLSRYVANLEGTLGEKLDKVTRNIGDYVVDVNETIKKEMKQIGELTEDNQQRSARYLQQAMNAWTQEMHQLNRQLQSISQETGRERDRVRIGTND